MASMLHRFLSSYCVRLVSSGPKCVNKQQTNKQTELKFSLSISFNKASGYFTCFTAPKTLGDIAGDIRRDFIDKFELYTDSSKGRTAQGRLSRGNSVGLDLVFAFDKSSSVGSINFQKGLNFTKALIDEFGVDHDSK